MTRVWNNKKKLKSIKPLNIDLPSGCKIYLDESLCKYCKHFGGNKKCYSFRAVFNRFEWQMGQYEAGIKTMS